MELYFADSTHPVIALNLNRTQLQLLQEGSRSLSPCHPAMVSGVPRSEHKHLGAD